MSRTPAETCQRLRQRSFADNVQCLLKGLKSGRGGGRVAEYFGDLNHGGLDEGHPEPFILHKIAVRVVLVARRLDAHEEGSARFFHGGWVLARARIGGTVYSVSPFSALLLHPTLQSVKHELPVAVDNVAAVVANIRALLPHLFPHFSEDAAAQGLKSLPLIGEYVPVAVVLHGLEARKNLSAALVPDFVALLVNLLLTPHVADTCGVLVPHFAGIDLETEVIGHDFYFSGARGRSSHISAPPTASTAAETFSVAKAASAKLSYSITANEVSVTVVAVLAIALAGVPTSVAVTTVIV